VVARRERIGSAAVYREPFEFFVELEVKGGPEQLAQLAEALRLSLAEPIVPREQVGKLRLADGDEMFPIVVHRHR